MASFKDVVGHKDIIKYIHNAVEENKVSHAYILNGERGSGKKMLANLLPTNTPVRKTEGRIQCNDVPFLSSRLESRAKTDPPGYYPGEP